MTHAPTIFGLTFWILLDFSTNFLIHKSILFSAGLKNLRFGGNSGAVSYAFALGVPKKEDNKKVKAKSRLIGI